MKFALLTVSYSGLFYKGKVLDIEQQLRKAKAFGFDAMSIETKRPIASPLDLSKDDRKRIRETSKELDIALCAVESMSRFGADSMEERENNQAMMRLVLDFAKDLGINLVKVFADWPGIIDDEDEVARYVPYNRGNYFNQLYAADLKKWHRVLKGLRETADRAADMGITLALQNHAPVLRPGYEDVLAMMQEAGRPNIKLCLDAPLFYERQSDEYITEAISKCASSTVLTHFGAWNFNETTDGEVYQEPPPTSGVVINYKNFIAGLLQAGYDGYFVSEYCLPVIRDHQVAGIEEIDLATRRSLKYMKDLVHASMAMT